MFNRFNKKKKIILLTVVQIFRVISIKLYHYLLNSTIDSTLTTNIRTHNWYIQWCARCLEDDRSSMRTLKVFNGRRCGGGAHGGGAPSVDESGLPVGAVRTEVRAHTRTPLRSGASAHRQVSVTRQSPDRPHCATVVRASVFVNIAGVSRTARFPRASFLFHFRVRTDRYHVSVTPI